MSLPLIVFKLIIIISILLQFFIIVLHIQLFDKRWSSFVFI